MRQHATNIHDRCGAIHTWRLRSVLSFAWLLLLTVLTGCSDGPADSTDSRTASQPEPPERVSFDFEFNEVELADTTTAAEPQQLTFRDVAAQVGIDHTYQNGTSPRLLMVESTGGGVGWLDLDQDGRPDLCCPQGGQPDAPKHVQREPDRLFRQLPSGQFVDVAQLAGIHCPEYGQGIGVADFNQDGFDDILITNVGQNRLFASNGDGTFRDVTDRSGLVNNLWSSSVAWGDIDKDGDLDLYVCNYAEYDPYNPRDCRDEHGVPAICHPRNVDPEPDQFFLNNGDATFSSAEQTLGLFGEGNRGLGVVISDLDRDGWPDIYVANDTTANFLFINQSGTGFVETATRLGGAVNALGGAQASMGIGIGDYDDNGFLDLCLTHFTGEYNTLYQNLGPRGFNDVTALVGLRDPTLPKLGFGVLLEDLNFDTHCDLVFANGHIDPNHPDGEGYSMTPQVLSYNGRRWQDQSAAAGDFFQIRTVGRGLAMADYDSDGRTDLAFVSQNTPTALLRNTSDIGHWLRLRLIGTSGNRDAIGTQVTLSAGGREIYRELLSGMSYASAQQRVLTFGLGQVTDSITGEVRWLSGERLNFTSNTVDQTLTILESGRILSQ